MDLEELYNTQVSKVYKFFYIQCLDRHIAEDLTSQSFYILIDKSKVLRIENSKKYLYGIMRKVWLEYLREKYKFSNSSVESMEDFESFVEVEIKEFENKALKERMSRFVDRLPESQKKVIILRHYEDQIPKQIAEILGKDMNYVKVTYKRALKSLRKLIGSPHIIYEDQGASE